MRLHNDCMHAIKCIGHVCRLARASRTQWKARRSHLNCVESPQTHLTTSSPELGVKVGDGTQQSKWHDSGAKLVNPCSEGATLTTASLVVLRHGKHMWGALLMLLCVHSAGGTKEYLVRASYLEIYNEEIRDLLAKNSGSKLELKETPDKGVYVKDLMQFVAKSRDEINSVLKVGRSNRSVGATAMNQDSSRSHSIFTITVEMTEKFDAATATAAQLKDDTHIRVGKLNLVDLAGSERQSKTGAVGARVGPEGWENQGQPSDAGNSGLGVALSFVMAAIIDVASVCISNTTPAWYMCAIDDSPCLNVGQLFHGVPNPGNGARHVTAVVSGVRAQTCVKCLWLGIWGNTQATA